MNYPSATEHIRRKLNWMSRRLHKINDPSDIKEWLEAMKSAFEVLTIFLGDEELSSRILVAKKFNSKNRWDKTNFRPKIHPTTDTRDCKLSFKEKLECITEKNSEQRKNRAHCTRRVVKGLRRRVEKDMRPATNDGNLEPKYQEKKVEGVHSEVVGDVSKPDQERLQKARMMIKGWWNKVLESKIEIWRKKKRRNWGDEEEYIKILFENGDYEKLRGEMEEELLDHLPPRGHSEVMTKEEIKKYLMDAHLREFITK